MRCPKLSRYSNIEGKNAICWVTLVRPKISCWALSGSPKIYAIMTAQKDQHVWVPPYYRSSIECSHNYKNQKQKFKNSVPSIPIPRYLSFVRVCRLGVTVLLPTQNIYSRLIMSYQEHREHVGRACRGFEYAAQWCSLWKDLSISKVDPFVNGHILLFSSVCRIVGTRKLPTTALEPYPTYPNILVLYFVMVQIFLTYLT